MRAVHSFWSKPHRIRNFEHIQMPDYELLTLVLSALKWKQLNGSIRMVTDTPGREFFFNMGLGSLWSEPVSAQLDDIPEELDAVPFWAAGKLYALAGSDVPCVMLDTDMIIWKQLEEPPPDTVVTAHREHLGPPVYPQPDIFALKEGYAFPIEWDFTLDPANTAFMFIPDAEFRDYYVQSAVDFMLSLRPMQLDACITMCFAEQRLLPMCAAAKGRHLQFLFREDELWKQDLATHVWGHKQVLASDADARDEFCAGCVRRILYEFPEWAFWLSTNPQTKAHYLRVRQ